MDDRGGEGGQAACVTPSLPVPSPPLLRHVIIIIIIIIMVIVDVQGQVWQTGCHLQRLVW